VHGTSRTMTINTSTASRQGWKVVWVAFTVAVFGWGLGFYGPPVYLLALHAQHGWSIALISTAITAHYLVGAVLIANLPEAYRRFGTARVTMVGAIFAGAGAMAWANLREPWQLMPALLLSACGWAATSGAALNALVSPWFDKDRPKAISMAFNGASVGGVLFTPLWTLLIAVLGMSGAAFVLGTAMIVVIVPLARLVLWTLPPQSARHTAAPSSRRALMATRTFVTTSGAFALALFAQIGLFAHLIVRLTPDFGPAVAAAAISVVTLCAIFGRTLLGWVLGEHDRRVAMAANVGMQAIGSLLLAFGNGVPALAVGCLLFGLGVGNLTSLMPLIVQKEYRAADVGTVVALVTAINQAVFALAPGIFGWLRDLSGGYLEAFLLAAASQLASAAIVMSGRRPTS
jgi:MFS family permease